MSLQRIACCQKFFQQRFSVSCVCSRHTVQPTRESNQRSPAFTATDLICEYSTAVKPHMTSSMFKWKKKKRKSKAQQKKELENLQNDVIKLLTKRAFQLKQNKSLSGAYGDVVTTHTFSDFPIRIDDSIGFSMNDYRGNKYFSQSWALGQSSSDFVAQTLDSHVRKAKLSSKVNIKCDSMDTSFYSKNDLFQKDISRSAEPFDQSVLTDNDFSAHARTLLEDSFAERHDIEITHGDGRNHKSTTCDISSSLEESKSLTANSYSTFDFPDRNSLRFSGNKNERNLQSRLECLESELSSLKEIDELSTPSPIYGWDTGVLSNPSVDPDYVSKVTDESVPLPAHGDQSDSATTLQSQKGSVSFKKKVVKSSTPEWFHIENESSDKLNSIANLLSPKKGRKLKLKKEKINLFISKDIQELIDKSFVGVSCFTGCEKIAVRNLQFQSTTHKITSVEVFDRLIRSFAKKGDLVTIKFLFSMLRQQELTPTLQTYASCLEGIGRTSEPDVDLCGRLISDISKAGFDLAEIANTCSFESDEWDYVFKAIKSVQPNFVPNHRCVPSLHKNELLTSLNVRCLQHTVEKNQYALDMSHDEMMARAEKQMAMEKSGEIVVESISSMVSDKEEDSRASRLRNQIFAHWKHVLLQSFETKLASYGRKAQDNITVTLFPYLKLFPAEVYVGIIFQTLRELINSSEGYSPTQSVVQIKMGRAVNRKYNIEANLAAGIDKKVLKLYDLYMSKYLDKDYLMDNHRLMWLDAMSQQYDTFNMDMSPRKWPLYIIKGVGRVLLDMILYDLKVDVNLMRPGFRQRLVPAFCSIYRPDVSLVTYAEIKLHPVVMKLFKADSTEAFTFHPCIVPMLVPPVPWLSKNMGSLLLGSNALVRFGEDKSHIDTLKDVKESEYTAVLDSLNTLSACAWKINKPILDLQIEILNNKGNARLKVAPPATEFPPLPTVTAEMSSREKALLYRERIQLQQLRQDMHGLWRTDLYRLSIANKFRDETFWFPHSMDFRGRTYPLPPHFNHLGSDNVRGMLLFAKGKPLGEKGYDWLKIHLVNLTGLKKRCSNQERLKYANCIMAEILDSADHPLTGKKWWQDSDEPWQTLACCMEIAKIERFQGNKEDFICHFPVHQDGSCNGLQHYAALGRDQAGAESVNLHPFDIPQDVYSDVVELVERERKKDAENDLEIAAVLDGFIKRKVIKQTIMTTVYGVTKYGAKVQIRRQLKDLPDFPEDRAWEASLYLTDRTFTCLREMFTATKDIQDWLSEAARLISNFLPVDWITPLGFPVLQPYFKKVTKGGKHVDKFKPNTLKQKNAFPPNYIHSLDSTHMMLTSLFCMHAGITFVSVHDCYWTHACDVPLMNKVCREQFVNMHRQPLLEDLANHLVALVKRAENDPTLKPNMKKADIEALMRLLRSVPKRGTFDLDNVLNSTYFFS